MPLESQQLRKPEMRIIHFFIIENNKLSIAHEISKKAQVARGSVQLHIKTLVDAGILCEDIKTAKSWESRGGKIRAAYKLNEGMGYSIFLNIFLKMYDHGSRSNATPEKKVYTSEFFNSSFYSKMVLRSSFPDWLIKHHYKCPSLIGPEVINSIEEEFQEGLKDVGFPKRAEEIPQLNSFLPPRTPKKFGEMLSWFLSMVCYSGGDYTPDFQNLKISLELPKEDAVKFQDSLKNLKESPPPIQT